MQRLPVRPAIFVVAYLFGVGLIATVVLTTSSLPLYLNFLVSGVLMGFQLAWAWQATSSAAAFCTSGGQEKYAARNLALAKGLAVAVVVSIAVLEFLQVQTGGKTTVVTPFAAVATAIGSLGFFAFLWVAAATLCNAERVAGERNPHVLGTFFQFVYLFLGAPFIYRRLKTLGGASRAFA